MNSFFINSIMLAVLPAPFVLAQIIDPSSAIFNHGLSIGLIVIAVSVGLYFFYFVWAPNYRRNQERKHKRAIEEDRIAIRKEEAEVELILAQSAQARTLTTMIQADSAEVHKKLNTLIDRGSYCSYKKE